MCKIHIKEKTENITPDMNTEFTVLTPNKTNLGINEINFINPTITKRKNKAIIRPNKGHIRSLEKMSCGIHFCFNKLDRC